MPRESEHPPTHQNLSNNCRNFHPTLVFSPYFCSKIGSNTWHSRINLSIRLRILVLKNCSAPNRTRICSLISSMKYCPENTGYANSRTHPQRNWAIPKPTGRLFSTCIVSQTELFQRSECILRLVSDSGAGEKGRLGLQTGRRVPRGYSGFYVFGRRRSGRSAP